MAIRGTVKENCQYLSRTDNFSQEIRENNKRDWTYIQNDDWKQSIHLDKYKHVKRKLQTTIPIEVGKYDDICLQSYCVGSWGREIVNPGTSWGYIARLSLKTKQIFLEVQTRVRALQWTDSRVSRWSWQWAGHGQEFKDPGSQHLNLWFTQSLLQAKWCDHSWTSPTCLGGVKKTEQWI